MMHGPCGPLYNQCLCCVKDSKDGCCIRGLPKPFNSRTLLGEGKFPEYRRRSPEEGGNTVRKWVQPLRMDVEVANKRVVPYSLYLLKTFDSHINVEFFQTISAVKYLFLYNFKGEDLVTIETGGFRDEIRILQARSI